MSNVTLYYSPGACSLAAHIALEETGAKYDAKPVFLRKGEQFHPDYVKLNPKSKVPVLVVDGVAVTENVAILPYIADLFPQANLLPATGAAARAQAISKLGYLAAGVHPVIGRHFGPQKICDMPDSAPAVLRIAGEQTKVAFKIVDGWLAGREWALDQYSVVDAYLFVFMHWAKALKLDVAEFTNYLAHYDRVAARPAVKRVLEKENAAQAAAA